MVTHSTSGSTFLHPDNILAKAGLVAGKTVADFGSGGGYFVLAASRIVGDEGHVYAVDILKDALSAVTSKAKLYGLSNITTVWSDAEQVGAASQITDHSIDYVLLIQLLSQVQQHDNVLQEALRVMKPGGTLIIVDWRKNNLKIGPNDADRLTPEQVEELAARQGLSLRREIEAGPYHFGIIFARSEQ